MNRYIAAPGSRLSDKQAQKYGPEINRLIEEKGRISPADVVEAAKQEDNPLHEGWFTWDVQKAAEERWLEQAGELIRYIQVEIETVEGEEETIRIFHSVSTDEGPRYVNLRIISEDDKMQEEVIQAAYRELLLWRSKYKLYVEFFSIVQAIESLQL